MRKYNRLWGCSSSALIAALAIAGCASKPKQTYPLDVPAQSTTQSGFRTAQSSEEPVQLAETAPLKYIVKKGDTLWDIASHFLLDPWQWPEIWIVNDQVANPHLIYPGDELTLVWRDGRPGVMLGALGPRIRESSLDEAIPTIPIDLIRAFLSKPRLVTPDQLKKAPYLLEFVDQHMMGGADNAVFVKNLPVENQFRYDIVRLGDKYVDPDSGRTLGWEAISVGDAEIRVFGKPSTAVITRSDREARLGDHLLKPLAESFEANFYPRAPRNEVNARILSVFDGVSQIGQYHIVALSKGAIDGLEPGHVLSILQTGRVARDPYTERREPLPDTYAGKLMIFKVDTEVSYGLVMTAIREIHVLDRAVKPQPGHR